MDEVKMKLPSETMQPKCLQASHLVLHAIIKRLAKVVSPNPILKNVIFSVCGSKDSMVSPLLRTPGRYTITILCRQCEHKQNVLGEEPFLPIFDKLYDPIFHGAFLLLGYGKELDHFSISVIFRTLCLSLDDYINTDEIYQLLVNCRNTSCKTHPLIHCQLHWTCLKCFVLFAHKETDKSFSNFLAVDSVSYTSKFSLDTPLAELIGSCPLFPSFVVKLGPSVRK